MSWSFKAKEEKKCVITKRQEERDLVFLFLVCYFCKEKNYLRIMSVKKAPPRLLQVLALTRLLHQLIFKVRCLSRIQDP